MIPFGRLVVPEEMGETKARLAAQTEAHAQLALGRALEVDPVQLRDLGDGLVHHGSRPRINVACSYMMPR